MKTHENTDNCIGVSLHIPAILRHRGIVSISVECGSILVIEYNLKWSKGQETEKILSTFYANNIDKTLGSLRGKLGVLEYLTKDNWLDKSLSRAALEFIQDNWIYLVSEVKMLYY